MRSLSATVYSTHKQLHKPKFALSSNTIDEDSDTPLILPSRLKDMTEIYKNLFLNVIKEHCKKHGLKLASDFINNLTDDCSICLTSHDFFPNRAVLECGHVFHNHCILEYYGLLDTATCPNCRNLGAIIYIESDDNNIQQQFQQINDPLTRSVSSVTRSMSDVSNLTMSIDPSSWISHNDQEIKPASEPTEIINHHENTDNIVALHGIKETDCLIELQAPCSNNIPMDLCIIFDSSYSMNQLYDIMASGICKAITMVPAGSRVSGISFSSFAKHVFGLHTPDIRNIGSLVESIRNANIKAGTNLANGLKMAIKVFTQGHKPNRTKRVFVITDGKTEQKNRALKKMQKLATLTNNNITVCSLGSDISAECIKECMGDLFAGHYEHANDLTELEEKMCKIFSVSVMASDITVTLPNDCTFISSIARGKNEIGLGTMFSGQTCTILANVIPEMGDILVKFTDCSNNVHVLKSNVSEIVANNIVKYKKVRDIRIKLNTITHQLINNLGSLDQLKNNLEILMSEITQNELNDNYNEMNDLAEKLLLAINYKLEHQFDHITNSNFNVMNSLTASISRSISGRGRTESAPF